jgi:hypothetical protein
MNAFRKIRLLSLIVLVALLAAGLATTSAHANGSCHTPKYCAPSYCTTNYCYPSYCNYSFDYSCFQPASYCYPQQYCFPVTVYDCYGRPSVVWQTSYGQTLYNASLPVKFAQ